MREESVVIITRLGKRWLVQVIAAWALAVAIAGLMQFARAQAANVWFVAPQGNDANNCLTMASACQTISAAVGKAAAGDVLIFAAGTYTERVMLDKDLRLIGYGPDATMMNGGVTITRANVSIYDVTIVNGGRYWGGNVYNDSGILSLQRVHIVKGFADSGGGIYNRLGTVVLDEVMLIRNCVSQDGGGIYNQGGTVMIRNSIVISNIVCYAGCYCPYTEFGVDAPLVASLAEGAGIYNAGVITIANSTFSAQAGANWGTHLFNAGSAAVVNTTFSDVITNGNPYYRGSIANGGVLTLTNVTISNTLLDSITSDKQTWLKNTLFTNSFNSPNCYDGTIVSLGHNLDSGNSCRLNAAGDLTNTNPLLGPLADNGGPTPTHALLPGSPAIGTGDNNGCPSTDQRGVPRPQGAFCDIGAYEAIVTYTQRLYLPLIMH